MIWKFSEKTLFKKKTKAHFVHLSKHRRTLTTYKKPLWNVKPISSLKCHQIINWPAKEYFPESNVFFFNYTTKKTQRNLLNRKRDTANHKKVKSRKSKSKTNLKIIRTSSLGKSIKVIESSSLSARVPRRLSEINSNKSPTVSICFKISFGDPNKWPSRPEPKLKTKERIVEVYKSLSTP